MDESSSSDDPSAVRGSLVDSRRLLFEKYVTQQAKRPEGTDEAAPVTRQNGRLPRSVRAVKVNSFCDKFVPSNRDDARQPSSASVEAATVIRRRSLDDEMVATDPRQDADERSSSVPSPAAATDAHQSPSLPTVAASPTVAPTVSETSPPSGQSSQVPHNECHVLEDPPRSTGSGSSVPHVLCQSSADVSPPSCSKRVSYQHAMLNGAKSKLAGESGPPVLETPCSNSLPNDGKGDADHSRLRDCESLSLTDTVATLEKSSSNEDLSTITSDCNSSLNSSSREKSETVVVETISDEPASTDNGDKPIPTASNEKIASVADCDSFTESTDASSLPITNSSVESSTSNISARPLAVQRTKPTISSKPVRSVVESKPIGSSSPVAAPTTVTTDYPKDLNPFGDDDDSDQNDNSRKLPKKSRVDVDNEHDSTNPFGSDSDDDDSVGSKYPMASTNPFGSDSEEEEEADKGSASKTPVPLPRTKPITSSSPQPSPRPRIRVSAGYSSSEISPDSSCRKSSADSAELSSRLSSSSIVSTPRKKKPAPPPPPVQTQAKNSGSKDEQIRNSNDEQKKIINPTKVNPDDAHITARDLNNVSKKLVGQWKNKKGPAPARPAPLRRPVKEMPLEDIKVELEDIEIRYQELVRQTTQLEEKIHLKTELESAESSAVEEMVVQLFELVNEKNELFRRRSELVNMRKMHSLEVEQADIEYQIRCLMLRPESNKTDSDKASEEALVKRLVEIVEKRNEIIDLMDKDRLRETVEDESVTSQLEPKSKKDHKSKEKKKKSKKEKNKELEDSDKHSPSKLIKQKFMTLRHTAKKLHP